VNRAALVTSLLFAAAGVFMMVQGYGMGLHGMYGPGPGFIAFWAGLPLALLSLVWFGQVLMQPDETMSERFVVDRTGMLRIASVTSALVVFAVLLRPAGFNLAMLALLLFLFFAYSREHLVAKVAIACVASFGTHYVFERYLRVPLPYASIEFLQRLGF
jgi:putative tricarboxylic transport membrane protein